MAQAVFFGPFVGALLEPPHEMGIRAKPKVVCDLLHRHACRFEASPGKTQAPFVPDLPNGEAIFGNEKAVEMSFSQAAYLSECLVGQRAIQWGRIQAANCSQEPIVIGGEP